MENYHNQIIAGDCIAVMQQLPSDSVDVTFADPPFNLKKKYGAYTDQRDTSDYIDWCRHWLWELVRITKPTGSIFVHNIPKWLTYSACSLNEFAVFRHWIAWDELASPMGKSLQLAHYGILFYAKDPKQHKVYEIRYPHQRCRKCGYLHKDYGGKKALLHPFGPLVSDVWTDIHRVRHRKQRDPHPCQLPIHLLERILLMSSDAGDIILDPFIGTGTTAIAAKRLGRTYIGIDIDADYMNRARDKLAQENAESRLGDVWVSRYRNEIVTLRNKDWERLTPFFELPADKRQIECEKIKLKAVRV